MTKFRLLLLFILATSTIAFSQHRGGGMGGRSMPAIGKISGTVVDSLSGTKIEYANISLIGMRNDEIVDGGVTDVDGQFILRDLKLGRYKLIVEFIGFTKHVINPINLFPGEDGGIEQDLGVIELSPSSLMLDAVQVIDEEPMYINEIDKKVFNVAQSSTVTGGSAEDALNTIPNVNVDVDGQITLRGDSNVTILINGKPSVLGHGGMRSSTVENIPADMIEKIEVITSPSAKYDPDGMAGIINIILKKGVFEGFNGSVNATIGERDKLNISGNINYFVNKFNIFSSFTHKDEHRYGDAGWTYNMDVLDTIGFDFTFTEDSPLIVSDEISDIHKHNINNTFTIGSDYEINDKKSLTFNVSINQHIDSSFVVTDKTTSTFSSSTGEPDSEFTILEEGEVEQGQHIDFLLGYYQNYNKDQHHVSVELQHSTSTDEFIELDLDQSSNANHGHGDEEHGHGDEEHGKTTLQLDYSLPLNGANNFEFGFKSTLNEFNSDYETSKYPFLLDYKETIHAVYSVGTYYFNEKLGIMPGLRFETVNMNMDLQAKNSEDLNDLVYETVLDSLTYEAIDGSPYEPAKYSKLFPSLHLLYNLSEKQAIKVGFSLRTERPRLRSLNPTPPFTDTYIRIGNPNLKPEYASKIELDYSFQEGMKSLSVATYYTEITDMIHWWDKDEFEFDGVTYQKMEPDNIGSAKSFGLEFSAGFKPLPFWFAMVSTNAWYSKLEEVDDDESEPDLHGNSFGYFTFLMNKFFLPYIGQVELTARQFNLHTTSGKNSPKVMASLAVKQSFFDERLDMTFKIKNIFDDAGFELEEVIPYNSYDQIRQLWHIREGRTFYITFKYNFGELKETKRRQKKWDRDGSEGGGMGMDF